jgi:hypothetical protein
LCLIGGFISSRHNEITRLTANLLKEVCIDVKEEPVLQEITGEVFKSKRAKVEKDARLDISARGFWTKGQKKRKLNIPKELSKLNMEPLHR